jgi:photosystem II cytochrome c550
MKYFFTKTFFSIILLNFLFSFPVVGIELDESTRTVKLDSTGKTTVLTLEELKRGKRLFNASCSQCHTGGVTKTNPTLSLDPNTLSLANPPKNNIEALITYMKNPTSYDGLESIAEIHPCLKSADIFPTMKTLTEEDLYSIAGHILVQPKIGLEKWGGGKLYY